MQFFYLLIEVHFLDTPSHFLPANQNACLTTHNQSTMSTYSHLNTSIYQWESAYYLIILWNYMTLYSVFNEQ